MNSAADPGGLLSRAALGDESAFAAVVGPYERSLFRQCYRMLGSGPDAEEALQDTLLRAWRRLDTFEASGALGGWLYRIATNVCLDALRSKKARTDPVSLGPPSAPGTAPPAPDPELTWVEPVADALLMSADDPQSEVLGREDVSLAFVAALQRLPPRQRACLLLHDVLGFTQGEVAEALGTSAASINSLLFRARQAARPRGPQAPPAISDPRVQDLLERYLEAWSRKVPATVRGPLGVGPSKCPAKEYVNFAFPLSKTPSCVPVPENEPLGWTMTSGMTSWSLSGNDPAGVQATMSLTATLRRLLPPGETKKENP